MDIGGQDITIEHSDKDALGAVSELIFKVWPNAVIELGLADDEEIFLYENREAADSWEEFGRTEENDDQMIWIVFEPGQMHCVLKEGQSRSLKIIEKIGRAVNGTLHYYNGEK
ncbi:MAG TPA: hypothetical protein VM577_03255 [Anaerovoracaceae bacterium]|nr:hypothetical protein [Anaerovoracaceae bacterium]